MASVGLDKIMAAGVVVMVVVVLGHVLGQFAVVKDDLVHDLDNTTNRQSALNDSIDRGFNAIELLGISPIVLGGVAIIGILMGAFSLRGGGGL